MKKTAIAIMTMCIVLAICIYLPVLAAAAEVGDFQWEVLDNTLYISGSGAMADYTYGTAPWFAEAENITAVVVEEGVTSIGEYGLAGLTKAVKITLPEGLTRLSYQAFQNCAALTDITLPESLTAMGTITFPNCVALKSIAIPKGITKLPDRTFYGCTSLETVLLPDTLTTVGEGAFYECTALKTVQLPDSVTVIEVDAFTCSGIETIRLPDNVTHLKETFRYCRSLKSVTLPENLKSTDQVFQYCDALEEIIFPAGIENVGWYTLSNCDNMKRIIFQGDLPNIDLDAFDIGEVEIYFPSNNESWMDLNVLKNYGATPTYYIGDADNLCSSHSFGESTVLIPNTCVTYGAMGVPCTVCSAIRLDPWRASDHFYCRTTVQPGADTVGYYVDECMECGWRVVTFMDDVLKSWSDAVLYLQDALARRTTSTIKVSFWDTTAGSNEKAKALLDAARAHNGVPVYGDYLSKHIGLSSYVGSNHYEENGSYLNILKYSVGYYSTNREEQLVNVWLTGILKELKLDGKSDLEKTLLIHDYVVNRLNYDITLSRWSTYLALAENLSICQGYATLMYRMLLMAGIDCRYISGTAGGRHAWNIVKLDGVYYCLDATWDDPIPMGNENYNYFLKGTQEFYEDHTPDAEYQTPEFLAAYPLSETDYIDVCGDCGDGTYWWLKNDGTMMIAGEGAVKMSFDWPHRRIKRICIGAGITELKSSVFFQLSSVETILFEGDKPLMDSLGLFHNITVWYPGNNPTWQGIEADTQATWRPYLAQGVWGHNIRWIYFGDKTLEFFGSGEMKEEFYLGPWFTYHDVVKTAIFHEGITYICKDALYDCTQLTSVNLPTTLTDIGEDAFLQCQHLTSVTFPESLKTIGDSAFYGCSGLTELHFPKSLTALGDRAFAYCDQIKEITFQGNAPTIGSGCFTGIYDIPVYYSVNKAGWTADVLLGYGGFLEWIGVENIRLGALSDITAFIGEVFTVTLEADGENLHFAWYLDGQPVGGDANPLTLTATEDMYHKSLYCIVTNEDGDCVTSNSVMLDAYDRLEENVTRNLSVDSESSRRVWFTPTTSCLYQFTATSAGYVSGALYKLSGGFVEMGNDNNGGFVFSCRLEAGEAYLLYVHENGTESQKLEVSLTVTILHEQIAETVLEPHSCTEDGLSSCTCGVCGQSWTQIVPARHTFVSGFCVICGEGEPIADGELTSTLRWELCGTTLRIFGSGAMPDFQDLWHQPWIKYNDRITEIVIDEGVTAVGDNAFMYCKTAITVSLPQTLTRVGGYAFNDCAGILNLSLPQGLKEIGARAFYGCAALTVVKIPEGVTSIESYTFAQCSGLTSVTISGSVASIGESAFSDCSSLTDLTICDGVVSIGEGAFDSCGSLINVIIPRSVTYIGDSAFFGCSNLTGVVIGDGVTGIGEYAFYGCSNLTSITIGYSVAKIESRAFYSSTGLKDVYYTGTKAQWDSINMKIGNTPLIKAALHLVPATIPGDLDGNQDVNEDDAIFLLQHALMPELFPVTQNGDFDKNGTVNEDDAIYLLQHVLMPELFPL